MIRKLKLPTVLRELKDKGITLFSLEEFRRNFGVSYQAAAKFLEKYTKKKFFVRFKKGIYVVAEERPPLFVIANRLYSPSYISLESALSFYNMIPEVVYSVTSVTTKPTREFSTGGIDFTYSHIKKEYFTGYTPIEYRGTTVLIAEPEKTLVDYLYFVSLGRKSLNERLSLRDIKKTQVDHFVKLFGKRGIKKLVKKLGL